jgi:signal transduction histidine kinase
VSRATTRGFDALPSTTTSTIVLSAIRSQLNPHERFAHSPESGKKRGFGLGLALVSEIAQRSHGDIAIETTGPGGTVFLLKLPTA